VIGLFILLLVQPGENRSSNLLVSKNLEVAKGHDKRKPHRLLAEEVTLGKEKEEKIN